MESCIKIVKLQKNR